MDYLPSPPPPLSPTFPPPPPQPDSGPIQGDLSYEHETSPGADVIAAAGGAATALAAPPSSDGSFAQAPVVNEHKDIGRNDPCWCGSGKKYKRCHGA